MQLAFNHGAVLIIGGGCDIGTAAAVMLARAHVPVCLTASSDESKMRLLSNLQAQEVSNLPVIICNLNQPETADALPQMAAAELEKAYGAPLRISYLLDLAQTDYETLLAAADPQTVTDYITANIAWRGRMLRAASRAMLRSRNGRMVFASSTAAALPNAGQGLYSAAKQAGEALYKSLGVELAERGITTCSLRLGYVDAGRGARYLHRQTEEKQRNTIDRIPMRRAISVEEAASTLLYLLSDYAVAINATTITMDGGLSACK